MVIEVRLYASLRRYRPEGSDTGMVAVDVPDGISLGELLSELEIDTDEIKLAAVNGNDSSPAKVLSDGDRVELFPRDFAAKA
ncbi:MoaD/ThiS family protein [Anaeroselena agilis]|uniref:MoaD/ThiS family protein n=1 Tax=Anaeroselena agilis TaxID=3063788 RepID=A0ABU3NUP0_9FIRM|nr:MoaD/ThiS family protein [Selenomonadales bacterium 4137-cl]